MTSLSNLVLPVQSKALQVLEDDVHGFKQQISCNINCQTAFIAASTQGKDQIRKFLHINLTGTSVSVGNLAANTDHQRGYFLDHVEVQASIEEQGLRLCYDDPFTSSIGYTETASMSFSVEASGGTLMGTPVANIGVGWSQGNSVSHSYPDFLCINNSFNNGLVHNYVLAMQGYDIANPGYGLLPDGFKGNLADKIWNTLQFWNPDDPVWGNIILKTPPHLATSTFPVLSQGIWSTVDNSQMNSKYTLNINVMARLVLVVINISKTGGNSGASPFLAEMEFNYRIPIDFSLVSPAM